MRSCTGPRRGECTSPTPASSCYQPPPSPSRLPFRMICVCLGPRSSQTQRLQRGGRNTFDKRPLAQPAFPPGRVWTGRLDVQMAVALFGSIQVKEEGLEERIQRSRRQQGAFLLGVVLRSACGSKSGHLGAEEPPLPELARGWHLPIILLCLLSTQPCRIGNPRHSLP